MSSQVLPIRWLISAMVVLGILASPVLGHAQTDEIAELNERGVEAFTTGDIHQARELFRAAAELARFANTALRESLVAGSLANLGVVVADGFGNPELAEGCFRQALAADSGIELDARLEPGFSREIFVMVQREMGLALDPTPLPLATEVLEPPAEVSTVPRSAWFEAAPHEQASEPAQAEPAESHRESAFRRVYIDVQPLVIGWGWAWRGRPADRVNPAPNDPKNLSLVPGTDPVCDYQPREYCVRVMREGFIPVYAAKLAFGVNLVERFALALSARIAYRAGEGQLSRIQLGLRAIVHLASIRTSAVRASIFLGGAAGQIQISPDQKGANEPWIMSGLAAGQLGASLGYGWDRFAIELSPELNVLFPRLGVVVDLGLTFRVAI